ADAPSGASTSSGSTSSRSSSTSGPKLEASADFARAVRRARSAEGRFLPRHRGHGHSGGGGSAGSGGSGGSSAGGAAPIETEGDEDFRGMQLELFASWTPLDRLTLTLGVPFVWNRIVEDFAGEKTRATLSGFGDMSLASSLVLWRNRDVLPTTWVEGRIWLKAPTGRDESKVEGVRDPHLQPGTGSWDFGVGLAAVHRFDWGSLYGSVFYRENTEGSLDYEYGDVALANLALEVPIGHAFGWPALTWLTGGLELNFRYAGYDEEFGQRVRDSGGAILYATPSVRIRLPWGFRDSRASLRAAVQIPLTQHWLHNTQDEGEVWSVGILLPF
ncbi:MAG: transporter, partial [Myxococcales bacterium]|nr:transporter [Myxococcales bacterium]